MSELPKREPGKAYKDVAALDETQEIDMSGILLEENEPVLAIDDLSGLWSQVVDRYRRS